MHDFLQAKEHVTALPLSNPLGGTGFLYHAQGKPRPHLPCYSSESDGGYEPVPKVPRLAMGGRVRNYLDIHQHPTLEACMKLMKSFYVDRQSAKGGWHDMEQGLAPHSTRVT